MMGEVVLKTAFLDVKPIGGKGFYKDVARKEL